MVVEWDHHNRKHPAMARYKPCDYSQLTMIPVSLADQLEAGTLEHTIHYVVQERLDLSGFDQEYHNDQTGRRAYDPRMLLQVVLLGYARGKLSSRRLEAACKENVIFMALCCGQRPDHSTIADFVSGMGEERISALFTQVLLVCEEEGLLSGTHLSIDGYKLSSNASKEWSGTHADLRQKAQKLKALVRERVREHRRNDRAKEAVGRAEPERVERLRKKAERIERFLTEHEPKVGRMGREVQSNVTDNQSAKIKSSHGILQGYNANAMVDEQHQVIVHAQAFGEGDDGAVAGPMLQGAQTNLAAAGAKALSAAVISADCGYFSQRNLEACEQAGVAAYIPDPHFRQRDVRFAQAQRHRRPTDKHKQDYQSKRRWFGPQDFQWDANHERLICPAGVKLHRSGVGMKQPDGSVVSQYRAARSACWKCELRRKCLRHPESGNPRQVRIYHRGPQTLTAAMRAKIDTAEGRQIYSRRLGIVEPVFANLAAQKGMNRSTLRGRVKVNIQWRLYCVVHNLEKIGKYGLN